MTLRNWISGASLCSPSRAALLTGRLSVRTGVYPETFPADAVYGLPPNETTLAAHVKTKGWKTMAIGKWQCAQIAFLPSLTTISPFPPRHDSSVQTVSVMSC